MRKPLTLPGVANGSVWSLRSMCELTGTPDRAPHRQTAATLAVAAGVRRERGGVDDEREAGFEHLGRLHGVEIAPVDRRHRARAVVLGERAVAAGRPLVVHELTPRARMDT